MDLTKEDREGEECSTEISLGGTPSRAALALAAAATAALVCENDEKQESQEASRLAVWNNSYQGQLAELAKREYASESIAGSSVGGASLLSDRAGNVSGGGRRTEKYRRAGM